MNTKSRWRSLLKAHRLLAVHGVFLLVAIASSGVAETVSEQPPISSPLPNPIATADGTSTLFDDSGVQFISHKEPVPAYKPYALFAANGVDHGAESSDSVTDRLDELEQQFQDLSSDYEKLQGKYGDLKSSLKNYAKTGHKDATMVVNGRVHVDNWSFPHLSPGANAFENGNKDLPVQDRIGFRRLRFGVKGDVWKNMLYKIEMEFAGGNKSEFRDAYLGFKDLPIVQRVLIGNQKRPYGLDHLNSSRYNVFLERPFVIEAFNQDSRRLGIAAYSYSEDLRWNWRYGLYNLRLVQDEGNYISDHCQGEFAYRLAHTPWYDECSDGRGYLHLGVAGTFADPDGFTAEEVALKRADNEARFRTRPEARTVTRWLDTQEIPYADNYQLLGWETVFNVGAFQFCGEYQNIWLQRNDDLSELHFHGGYMYVAYFLTGDHMPWDRKRGTLGRIKPIEKFFLVDRCGGGHGHGWGAWQVALRWSYLDLTSGDVQGGVGDSLTLGLNWYWNAYARMQFNYIYGNIYKHRPVDGETYGDYQIAGTRFMVDF